MSKKNNTLLYAGLGLAALLIFKKKSAGIGAIHSREWIINYINHRLEIYERKLPKLTDEKAIAGNIAVQEELHSILKHIYY